jgi:hypothetical protein
LQEEREETPRNPKTCSPPSLRETQNKKALVPERKRVLRERETERERERERDRSSIIKFCFVLCCELGFCGVLRYHQHHWELDPSVCVFVVVVVRKHLSSDFWLLVVVVRKHQDQVLGFVVGW